MVSGDSQSEEPEGNTAFEPRPNTINRGQVTKHAMLSSAQGTQYPIHIAKNTWTLTSETRAAIYGKKHRDHLMRTPASWMAKIPPSTVKNKQLHIWQLKALYKLLENPPTS